MGVLGVEIEDGESSKKEKKIYSFDEAISLTGTGWYNITLMATLSLSLLAMCIDMFSFSVVVQLNACDFQLNLTQKSILVSMPFIGPIVTAYAWGYISDTKGRHFSLTIAMVVSFVLSTLCAFVSNWIAMGLLKLLSTCFCSCAQSATFTLLGESSPEKNKGSFLIILSSITHMGISTYIALSYLIGNLDFFYDLGFITFVPWRLLVIVLALPLGISAVCLMFFYESPKYLLNVEQEDKALEVLRNIYKKNGGEGVYPVEQVILNETGNVNTRNVPLLQSLRDQSLPLFKPPWLFNTILLYTFIFICFSVGGALYTWLPFLANAFASGSAEDFNNGLCGVVQRNSTLDSTSGTDNCKAISGAVVIAALISGSTFSILNFLMSKVAHRRRLNLVLIFIFAGCCCFSSTLISNQASGAAYLGVLSNSLAMGPLFSYFVDLYPTSFRGMATCLAVMVSRISSVIGINVVGQYITLYCTSTFYVLSSLLLVAAFLVILLPPDKPKKTIV